MEFNPKFTVTTPILHYLASIEEAKNSIEQLPLTTKMIISLRESAKIISTHNSTFIEGNRLTLNEVKEIIQSQAHFPFKEKDETEVKNYYAALEYIDERVKSKEPITQQDIQILHGISFLGKHLPTPYRDGQNVIRSGKLVVYIPPRALDVQLLMDALILWINTSISQKMPLPIIAAMAHYQFATIHPYYDGNGRTARLLVTLLLQMYGYGLKGIYSLEEYYAKDLKAYYNALTVGFDEDYYEGKRAECDLTPFLEYFISGMADAFLKVKSQALITKDIKDQSPILRELSRQQKLALNLFIESKTVTTKEISNLFKFTPRQARNLCQKWVAEGFFEIINPNNKTRAYRLNPLYENFIQKQLGIL